MYKISKSQFVVETAAKLFVASSTLPKTDPDAKNAISKAIGLWEELEKQEFVIS
jgi:hypothetical protein